LALENMKYEERLRWIHLMTYKSIEDSTDELLKKWNKQLLKLLKYIKSISLQTIVAGEEKDDHIVDLPQVAQTIWRKQ